MLDAYSTPPAFKAYDRSSREFRRQSADAGLILGAASDIQPSDPVFVIRRSPNRSSLTRGVLPQTVDELDQLQQRQRASSETAPPRTVESSGPQPTQRELIAAQRAASQANQRALLVASREEDATDHSQTTLRADEPSADEFRYSLMGEDSTETDLRPEALVGLGVRPTDTLTRGISTATTTDAESFRTAQTSLSPMPTPLAAPGSNDMDEDERALADLRSADVGITPPSTNRGARSPSRLDEAFGAAGTEPRARSPDGLDQSLQDRLDRVLARVREDKARRAASPTAGQRPRSYIDSSGEGSGSGRFSPVNVAARSASAMGGRRSPVGDKKMSDSPSIEQIMSDPHRHVGAGAGPGQHRQKSSLASISSANSNSTATDQLSTPVTPSHAHSHGYTPASSATSNHRAPVVYPADYGFDFLAAVVAPTRPRPAAAAAAEPSATERLLGSSRDILANVHPDVRQAYEEPSRTLHDLETVSALLTEHGSMAVR